MRGCREPFRCLYVHGINPPTACAGNRFRCSLARSLISLCFTHKIDVVDHRSICSLAMPLRANTTVSALWSKLPQRQPLISPQT